MSKEVRLINSEFITEKRNQLKIEVDYQNGSYRIRLVKKHCILAVLEIPDWLDERDAPIPNDKTYDKINESLPLMSRIIEIMKTDQTE